MPPTSGRGTVNSDGEAQGPSENNHNQYIQQEDQISYQQQRLDQMRMSATGVSNSNRSMRRNDEDDHISRTIQPTPLFERLVTEEVQELKAYARIIESQNRRLAELERVHGDLEARLEQECRGREQLESTLERREREWSDQFKELEKDRDRWKDVVKIEKTKNSRLIDQVVRKDQDIHRMLQRKYDQQRESSHPQSIRNLRSSQADRAERSNTPTRSSPDNRIEHKSPHEILEASGDIEAVRIRNTMGLLYEFFYI